MSNITQQNHRPAATKDDPVYDFEHLGLKIAESLLLAAENQVVEAQNLYDRTKVLADGIREQVREQTQMLASLNGRLRTFGGQMLEAHRQFNGETTAAPKGNGGLPEQIEKED